MNQGAVVNLILGITIALLPLCNRVTVVDFSRTGKDNLLVIIFSFLCFLLNNKERKLERSFYVALIYGLFCLAFNHWHLASFNVIMQSFYIGIGLIFFATYYERHSKDGLHYILNGMAIGCIIQAVLVVSNKLGFNLWAHLVGLFNDDIQRVARPNIKGIGSLGNSNLLASYLALTIPALFRGGWVCFLPLSIAALFMGESIMGTLSLLAGVLYYLNLKYNLIQKPWVYLGAMVCMFLAPVIGVRGMDTNRFQGWKLMLEQVDFWHFLFGKGPGWFSDHGIVLKSGEIMTQEHNSFLTAFNMFGIVGIILVLPLFIKFIQTSDKSLIFPAILFTAFINSYGHFTLHQSTVAIIIIVAAAICLAEGRDHVVNMER